MLLVRCLSICTQVSEIAISFVRSVDFCSDLHPLPYQLSCQIHPYSDEPLKNYLECAHYRSSWARVAGVL